MRPRTLHYMTYMLALEVFFLSPALQNRIIFQIKFYQTCHLAAYLLFDNYIVFLFFDKFDYKRGLCEIVEMCHFR